MFGFQKPQTGDEMNWGGLKIPPSFNAVSGLRYFAHTCVIVYDIMLVRVMEKVHMLFFFI